MLVLGVAWATACAPRAPTEAEPSAVPPSDTGAERAVGHAEPREEPPLVSPRPIVPLVWTNRGFIAASLSAESPALVWSELPGNREVELARARAIHTQLPAIYACMRRALETNVHDANLHVRLFAQGSSLVVSESPTGAGSSECIVATTAGLSFAGNDALIGSLAMIAPRFARVLPSTVGRANLVRGLGGCHWLEVSNCGPADDCPMDGYRAGICPAADPALLALHVERVRNGHEVTRYSRVGADGEPTYVAALPFALPVDADTTAFEVPDTQSTIDVPNIQGAASAELVALVADTGTLVIRRADGELRFVEHQTAEESFGWDDAEGSVTVGRTRCAFTSSRHGRAAIVCGNRIVLVRGESTVYVLDERGTLLERKVLTPSYPGFGRLHPHVEGRVSNVTLVLDGHIYVR